MPWLIGVAGQTQAQSVNTVDKAVDLFALTPNISALGNIGFSYGLYVQPQKVAGVTHGFGIYQASAMDNNYFAGTVNSVGGFQSNGTPGFTGTKTAGGCVFSISGGIITNVTGC
jgi:hypothetical protein